MSSHVRGNTYDGAQMAFTMPLSQSSTSFVTPSIETQSNVSLPITSGSNRDRASHEGSSAAVTRNTTTSLKRSKAVRSKVGWLTRKLRAMGAKFARKVKNWRVIGRKKANSVFRRRSLMKGTGTMIKRWSTIGSSKKAPTKREHGSKSIVELRREIDHWYAPQHPHTIGEKRVASLPPVPPPHRVITPLANVPTNRWVSRSSSRSSTRSSTRSGLPRTGSFFIPKEKSQTEEDYSLQELLYAYLTKIIISRIETKLNIAHLEKITQSRQSSYIRQNILHNYGNDDYNDIYQVYAEDSEDDEVSSMTSSSTSSTSSISSNATSVSFTASESSILGSSIGSSVVDSMAHSAYYSAESQVDLQSRQSPPHVSTVVVISPELNHERDALKEKFVRKNSFRYADDVGGYGSVMRAQTLPLNWNGGGGVGFNGARHLKKISEYVVEVENISSVV